MLATGSLLEIEPALAPAAPAVAHQHRQHRGRGQRQQYADKAEQLAAGHVGHLKSAVHFLSWGLCLCGCCCKMERDAARLAKNPPKEVKLESLSTRPWPAQLEGGIADWQTGRRKPQNPYALEDDRPADAGQGGTRTLALTNK